MLRPVKEDDLRGKTVSKVECDSFNCLRLTFDDGTTAELWSEVVVITGAGTLAGILIEDPSMKE